MEVGQGFLRCEQEVTRAMAGYAWMCKISLMTAKILPSTGKTPRVLVMTHR